MRRKELLHEELTRSVIGAFFVVYNKLRFGHFEHVYVMALERELRKLGHRVGREVAVNVYYDGEILCTQRLDMIVDEVLIVETKSTRELHPAARRQLLSYLHATNLEVGLLLHFGPKPKFHREICDYDKRSVRSV
jgi:GxxExxY protein